MSPSIVANLPIYRNTDHLSELVQVASAFIATSICCVSLRFIARKVSRTRLGADDYLTIPAALLVVASCALAICKSCDFGFAKRTTCFWNPAYLLGRSQGTFNMVVRAITMPCGELASPCKKLSRQNCRSRKKSSIALLYYPSECQCYAYTFESLSSHGSEEFVTCSLWFRSCSLLLVSYSFLSNVFLSTWYGIGQPTTDNVSIRMHSVLLEHLCQILSQMSFCCCYQFRHCRKSN